VIVSIPYLSYYKRRETGLMIGADSNYEANSKKVLWSYCYKALLINLFWARIAATDRAWE